MTGTYSNEDQTILRLNKDQTFILEIDQISTTIFGTYSVNSNKLILDVEKSDYKPFKIEIPAQTYMEGYEFQVRGKNWGPLSRVHCKIEENGEIIEEAITNEQGVVKFDFVTSGKLIVGHLGWEAAEIDLSTLTVHSAIVILEREKFIENISSYNFEIEGSQLKGLGSMKDWRLKKEKR